MKYGRPSRVQAVVPAAFRCYSDLGRYVSVWKLKSHFRMCLSPREMRNEDIRACFLLGGAEDDTESNSPWPGAETNCVDAFTRTAGGFVFFLLENHRNSPARY